MVLWIHIFLECLFRHFCILHCFGIVVICVKCIAHIHVLLCNSTIKSFWYAMAKVTLIKRNFMFEYFELDIYYRNTLLWKIKTTVFTHSKTVFIPLRRLKFAKIDCDYTFSKCQIYFLNRLQLCEFCMCSYGQSWNLKINEMVISRHIKCIRNIV